MAALPRKLNLTELKMVSEARQNDEAASQERKRSILVLLSEYLNQNGYCETVQRLQTEAGSTLSKYVAADNMDLLLIFKEFEEYYKLRFGRLPKFVRKTTSESDKPNQRQTISTHAPASQCKTSRKPPQGELAPLPPSAPLVRFGAGLSHSTSLPDTYSSKPRSDVGAIGRGDAALAALHLDVNEENSDPSDLGITGSKVSTAKKTSTKGNAKTEGTVPESGADGKVGGTDYFEQRVLKPMPDWGNEFRELAQIISRDIYLHNPNVKWDDIADLQSAKQLLKEAVVMPMQYPELFTGLLSPWKGILLCGPPGTGKTMLARAVATECRTTFFNISASSIVSKWRGDSEKLVRVLFDLARYHAPSTIFIDEMDAIMGKRDEQGEHEGSRRLKTELLIQMDGLAKSNDLVFVLAASNLPWDLDSAMLRRLDKRILVPLPTAAGRLTILRHHLASRCTAEVDMCTIAERTHGYSGSDLVLVCKEAAMRPLRRLMTLLTQQPEVTRMCQPVRADSDSHLARDWSTLLEPVSMRDIEAALGTVKPSATSISADKYRKWHQTHGADCSTNEDDFAARYEGQ